MNKKNETTNNSKPMAYDALLGCVFVINYDEAIIFRTNKGVQFYDETYDTFDEAKEQLISYWDNALSEANRRYKEVKKYKLGNVQYIP